MTITDTIAIIIADIPRHTSQVPSDAVAVLPIEGSALLGFTVMLDTAALRDIYRALLSYFVPTAETLGEAKSWARFIDAARLAPPDYNGNKNSVAHVAGLVYALAAVEVAAHRADLDAEDFGPSYAAAARLATEV